MGIEEEEAATRRRLRAIQDMSGPMSVSPIVTDPVAPIESPLVDHSPYAPPPPPMSMPEGVGSGAAPVLRQTPQSSTPGSADRILVGGGGAGSPVDSRVHFDQASRSYLIRDTQGNVVDRRPIPEGMSILDSTFNLLSPRERINVTGLPVRAEQPRGPRVPPGGSVTTGFRIQQEAPLSAATQAELARTGQGLQQAQQRVDQNEQREAQQRALAQQELATEAARTQQEEARREADRQAQLTQRMDAFNRSIQDVAAGQVDPEGFFGNDFGRRAGAAVAVALGQLGSMLGGGPNVALQTINSAIERNIAAQERNLQIRGQAAGLQGQALAQYRTLMGDDRAAQEAARAAHLAAVEARLNGRLASAAPEQLAGIQALRDRVAEARAAAEQAARDRGAFSIATEITSTQRMSPQAANPSGAFGMASLAQSIRGMPEDQARALLEREGTRDRLSQQTGIPRRGRRRPAGSPAPSSSAPQAQVPTEDVLTPEQHAEMVETTQREIAAQGEASVPDLTVGGVVEHTGRLGQQQFANRWRDAGVEQRQQVDDLIALAIESNDLFSELEQMDDPGFWGSLTDGERAQHIRMVSSRIQGMVQNQMFQSGVINSPAELERLGIFFNDWSGRSVSELTGADSIFGGTQRSQINTLRRLMNSRINARLSTWGLGLRTSGSRANRGGHLPPRESVMDAPQPRPDRGRPGVIDAAVESVTSTPMASGVSRALRGEISPLDLFRRDN